MRLMFRALVAAFASASLIGVTQPAQAGALIDTTFVIGVVADAPTDVAGRRLTIAGGLVTDDGDFAPVAGREVRVQVRPSGRDAFRTIATVVTDAQGHFHASYVPWRNFDYRVRFAGDDTFASSSHRGSTRVAPRVRINVSDDTVRQGRRVVVWGRAAPDRSGREVRLFQGRTCRGGFCPDADPNRLATGVVRDDGTYRLVGRARWDGRRRIFVDVAGGGHNSTGWSPYRWVTTR